MSVYKETKTNTWRVVYRYVDWTGEKKQTQKRGFKTKREALAWEREQMNLRGANLEMTFESFIQLYEQDIRPRVKERTWANKENVIQTKLLPYFGKLKMCNITPQQIIAWQNEMINYRDEKGNPYSQVYLRNLHSHLSAIFNHAVKFYDLRSNPCTKAGTMGKKKAREMLYWTKGEYLLFAEEMMLNPDLYYAFEMLYWCGIRKGEMLALTPADFDLSAGTVSITKTYYRKNKQDIITAPKTEKSIRVLKMPQILWSKRCKDKSLVGTVKETIMQVSRSKKWQSQPALDENGDPILNKKGKKVLRPSYAVLQDDFFNAMQNAGYTDLQRGERGSTEEHLTVTQFKVQQEQRRLLQLQEAAELAESEKEDAEQSAKQAQDKLNDVAPKLKNMEKLAMDFSEDPERLLPQPAPLESAKAYREKKAKPLVQRMVKVLRSVYRAYLDIKSKYDRLSRSYNKECARTASMREQIDALQTENRKLKETVSEYGLVKRSLGASRITEIIQAAKQSVQQKKHREHTR